MTVESTTPQTFKHPGLSKLGKTSIAGWPRRERSAKFWPRMGSDILPRAKGSNNRGA